MILCTGDLHGTNGLKRLKKLAEFNLTYDDYLIVVGDFGIIWHNIDYSTYYDKNQEGLSWLKKNVNCNVLFIDGNHENFDMIEQYPVEEWNGGKVHRINDQVRHLMRGEVFDIEGIRFFAMGGARSIDRGQRVAHKSWWPQEIPSEQEIEYAFQNFIGYRETINYVITHEAPEILIPFMVIPSYRDADYHLPKTFTGWYTNIRENKSFKKWIFGHYHQDKELHYDARVIYEDIIELR